MFRGNHQERQRDWTVCPIWKSQRNQDVWPGENLCMHACGGAADRQRGHFQIFKGITHEKVELCNIQFRTATLQLRKDFLMIHTERRLNVQA